MFKKTIVLLLGFVYPFLISIAQNDDSWKVYDDSEIAVINITMNSADLNWMYENPESDSMHLAQVHFQNSLIDETIDSVGIRIRGNTSRLSAKKSFKLSFNTFIKGGKFYSLEKINLNGEHNDPSIIRSKLCWDFFNEIGVVSSRAAHAAVYINDKYYGLYISVEHIDENFIDKHFNEDSGNLWKCLYGADLNNENQLEPYTLKTNEEANDYSELDTLIKVINNTQLNDFENIIGNYFNAADYLKIQAVDILVGSWDNYSVLSNNYYLYHNPSNDIVNWIPYDYDNTFGIDWLGFDWAFANPYDFGLFMNQPRPLYNRLLQVPKYKDLLNHFIEYYSDNYIYTEQFNRKLDTLRTLIEPFALIDSFKSFDWGFTNSDFLNSFEAETFVIDPHVKYSIKKYNELRKESLFAQLEYSGSNPIIYDIEIINDGAINVDNIIINVAAFSQPGIHSVSANLMSENNIEENYPFSYNPGSNTFKVEEADKWTVNIGELNSSGKYILKIIVQDNNGSTAEYPNEGIEIYKSGDATKEIVISELMSLNSTTIQDNAGEYDDWLEIYNPSDTTVILSGKYLTDKMENLTKWKFPENVKILPKQYILIWCDEDQEQAGPHINFKLSSNGEFVALIDKDGYTIIDSVTFPAMQSDESYSRINNTEEWIISPSPTPGTTNIISSVENIPNTYKNSLSAYPNPFNPTTIIEFEVQEQMDLQFYIYNILGEEVWSSEKILANPGKHNFVWNGRRIDGGHLSSGLYIVYLKGDSYNDFLKLLLIR